MSEAADNPLKAILAATERATGFTGNDLVAYDRRPPLPAVRRAFARVAHYVGGFNQSAIGRFMCRDHSTIGYALKGSDAESRRIVRAILQEIPRRDLRDIISHRAWRRRAHILVTEQESYGTASGPPPQRPKIAVFPPGGVELFLQGKSVREIERILGYEDEGLRNAP